MYYEIEGRYNMENLVFDEDCFIVGNRSFPYDQIEKLEITSEPLFAAYGILTMIFEGKEVSIPFARSSGRKIRRALKELERERAKTSKNSAESQEKRQADDTGIPSDPYEEVKKLKELLDLDIITEEEFQKKKSELLHL